MKQNFPVRIVEQNNQFKAGTSLNILSEKSKNILQELSYIEVDYTNLINLAGNLYNSILIASKSKKADPRFYWLLGDCILGFIHRINDLGYYLLQQNKTLATSVKISESSIKKIISFRKRFSKISAIDPAIPWAKYRDNKIPIQK